MNDPLPADGNDVRLARRGDREAFARLYDLHAPRVRAVVAAVSQDFGVVEDLTQETFLRAWGRIESLRDADGFGPWIAGVARLVARERRRRLRRRREVAAVECDASDDGVQASRPEASDEVAALLRNLGALPERERLAIHAYYFRRQRSDAAAADLGLSRSGYYALLQRAHERLRNAMDLTPPNVEGPAP